MHLPALPRSQNLNCGDQLKNEGFILIILPNSVKDGHDNDSDNSIDMPCALDSKDQRPKYAIKKGGTLSRILHFQVMTVWKKEKD